MITAESSPLKIASSRTRRSGSYIGTPDKIKKKKATINTKNEDDKGLQNAATVALHYGEIESHPEGTSNNKSFIKEYNWKGISYLLKIDD